MFSISPSKIDSYKQCPFKYKCDSDTAIRKKYKKDTPDLTFGNLIHACLNDFYKRTKKEERTPERLRQLFEEKFKQDFSKHAKIFGSKENIINYVNKSKECFKNFVKSEFFSGEPLMTEEYPKVLLGDDLEIGGKFDRVDISDGNELTLIDYKTGKFRDETANEFQLDFYDLLLSKFQSRFKVKEKILFYLGENRIIRFNSNPQKYVLIEDEIKKIANTIASDKELKPRINNLCRYCDYISICSAQNKQDL